MIENEKLEKEVVEFMTVRIMALAVAGIHKKSIFDMFQPFIRLKYINKAVRLAKEKGMFTIPQKRHETLGSYYRVEQEPTQSIGITF